MATEDANQTLKTVLTRSTSRLKLLAAKAGATATYVLTLLLIFGLSGVVIGSIASGAHAVTIGGVPLGAGLVLGAPSISVTGILSRLGIVLLVYAGPLLAVSAWGFLLSVITRNSRPDRPAAGGSVGR